MANLNEYMKDADENNIGNDIQDFAKDKTKGAAKKAAKKGVNKILDKTGINAAKDALKAAAKKGTKAVAKAAGTAAKTGLKAFFSFLVSNPIGWVIGIILIVLIIGLLVALGNVGSSSGEEMALITGSSSGSSTLLSDDEVIILMNDCPVATVDPGEVDEDANTTRNAQQLYSVFKSYGLTDECIAGILGNLSTESGIDPTGIEGIYDEPFLLGPKKQAAIQDLSNYTQNTLFPMYGDISINHDAYRGTDGNYYCGLGLIQWTGPGAEKFLTVADSVGIQWYTLKYQLAYMVGDTHYRPGFFANWKANPDATPEDAATTFARDYEGNTVVDQEQRRMAARSWYEQMDSWTADAAFANSVLALAQSMGGEADDIAVGESADRCQTNSGYDNSSMAAAAVSYAYPTKDQGNGNNGTELFQRLENNIFGDGVYMSCDRGVAVAVRWSGSDDTYPAGNTNYQYDYLLTSPKWQSLGMAGSLSIEDLQPGDVFILDGHTFMYTGHDLIASVHGDAAAEDADSVSASYGERSPGCGNDTSQILGRGGVDWIESRGQYEVFRCIQPDHSTTYQNAGSDAVMGTPGESDGETE